MRRMYLQRTLPTIAIMLTLALFLASCGTRVSTVSEQEQSQATQQPAAQADAQGPPVTAEQTDAVAGSANDYTPVIAFESGIVDPSDRTPLKKGETAPDFSYTLTDGTTASLSDLHGKKVMINFWATWCPPCNAEMPDIQEAFEKHKDNGFVVLAVSQDLEIDLIEPFAQKYALTFPLIADPQNEISSRYGARGLPSSYFVNSDGTIDAAVQGVVTMKFIDDRIAAMK